MVLKILKKKQILFLLSLAFLVVLGVPAKAADDFSDIEKLSYNQRRSAVILDKLNNIDSTSNQNLEELKEIIDSAKEDINTNQIKTRQLLSEASPYFIANLVRSVAVENFNKELYSKIAYSKYKFERKNDFWVQSIGDVKNYDKDENSIEKYEDDSYGAMLGIQNYITDKFKLGVFGGYKRNFLKQGKSSADVNNTSGGIYGGYIAESFEIRATVAGGYNKYFSNRHINCNLQENIAKSEFGSVTFSADLEFSYKYFLDKKSNLIISPYAGVETSNVNYGGFKEYNVRPLNLEIDGKTYNRSVARIGGEVGYDSGKFFALYGMIEIKYILDGNEPEISFKFADIDSSNVWVRSRGFEEYDISVGLGGGIEMRVCNFLSVFAESSFYSSSEYSNLFVTAGIRNRFGSLSPSTDKSENRKGANSGTTLFANSDYLIEKIKESIENISITVEELAPKGYEVVKKHTKLSSRKVANGSGDNPIVKFVITLKHFENETYILDLPARDIIVKLSEKIREDGEQRVFIESYSNDGDAFAQIRAEAIRLEFIKNGIPKQYLIIDIHKIATDENNRVEVFVD
ncbi:MAG: autotransporter domain-containing protein [Elusimicrobiota bacterium]|jgi:hypothetical protein|nr:autotransporter domain-containing protein [Elusimicrobiota bacterium]